jgi:hypothetical protein
MSDTPKGPRLKSLAHALSAKQREKLARFIGYRSELDCLMADIRAELVRDPEWRLTPSDQQQYRETVRKFQNHGVTTVPCQIAERGDQFLRQLRPIRLVLESDINALEAKRGPQSAARSHGAQNKGGRKPGIILDGGQIAFFRGEYSQRQVANFGGISLASVQRAEAEKPVSKVILAAIRKALRRCCGHPVTIKEISKKPTSETSES